MYSNFSSMGGFLILIVIHTDDVEVGIFFPKMEGLRIVTIPLKINVSLCFRTMTTIHLFTFVLHLKKIILHVSEF